MQSSTEPASSLPDVPLQLVRQPTIAGLAVPWTTARMPDGRYRFGAVDLDRNEQALTARLCQTCGTELGEPMVFVMRDRDLRMLTSHEPAMHPVCAMYSAVACPMLSGRMSHYQAAPAVAVPGVVALGDPAGARPGAQAERWQRVWARGYSTFTHPKIGQLAALVLPEQILRVRPIDGTGPRQAPGRPVSQ